jgi:hypothetical protein
LSIIIRSVLPLLAVTLTATALPAQRAGAAQGIAVRFPEGTVHGFLQLHDSAGRFLATGDLTQVDHDGTLESRMSFRFADSSHFDETVAYTQHGVFALTSYHLVQRGPAFAADLDASFSAGGSYLVTATSHDDRKAKVYRGTLQLPADVSNGLPIILLRNLAPRDSATVHLVAFMPAPRLIQLRLTPVREAPVFNGAAGERATEYDLKPVVGGLAGFFGKLLGKIPPDSHVWIVTQDAPMFVRFAGPLYVGPVWRIDLALPQLRP